MCECVCSLLCLDHATLFLNPCGLDCAVNLSQLAAPLPVLDSTLQKVFRSVEGKGSMRWRAECRPRCHAWSVTALQLGGQPVCQLINTSVKNLGLFTACLITLPDLEPLWSFDALMVLWSRFSGSVRSRGYKLTVSCE